jgi:hypothetical protein
MNAFSGRSRVSLTDPDLMALAFIAERMRERDRVECLATCFTTPAQLAADAMLGGGFCNVAWIESLDGAHARPVAAIGARQRWPGVWSVWAWGTDEWPKVVVSLTRHAKRTLIPLLVERGAHRAQCASLAEHAEAHRWLEYLGAKREATLTGYGRNGEDFALFRWRLEDVQ